MPYAIVIWKRGSNIVDIAGLKQDDLDYLEKIPCLATRLEVDSEGFIRFGPASGSLFQGPPTVKAAVVPSVVLTGLEVLGFRVVTTTATSINVPAGNKINSSSSTTEYSWTLRREFSEPEPQD